MKKILFISVFNLLLVSTVFSVDIQRLTFTDMRSDGTIIGSVTVNAVFLGWSQQEVTREGNFRVIRERVYLANGSEWSPWELVTREPAPVLTLRQEFDMLLREYNLFPRASIRIRHASGGQAVKIMDIPSGRSSPIWWRDDGRAFFAFCRVYAIIP